MVCNCNTKSFLHNANCSSVPKPKIPLSFLQREGFNNPGNIIFYVAATPEDSLKQMETFRQSLREGDWLYHIQSGLVGSLTLNNTTEITFVPEDEAFILLELPNSNSIFFELTSKNKDLAEQLTIKTGKISFVDPITKELM